METVIIALSIYFFLWFVVLTLIKNAGYIDIAWGLGFVLIAWVAQLTYNHPIGWVIVALVSMWGLRLAYHIGKRNIGKPEDFRYQNFRREWGKNYFVRSIFQIYLLQGVLMFIVSLSFLEGLSKDHIHTPILYALGLLLFVIGYGFEVIGDAQLRAHSSNPSNKGKLMKTGLWSMTRHPNYFGESVLWSGLALMSLGLNTSFVPILGALTITILVRYVSGVPLLETRMKKYEGFEEYAKDVPIFFPKIK
jgi:steroid 5-alpha reductase family enzyme